MKFVNPKLRSLKKSRTSLTLLALSTLGMASTPHFLNHTVAPAYRLEQQENPFAQKNIEKGYLLLQQIMDGSYCYLAADRETDALDVVAVMWALYDAAVAKGQGYEQGSFVVEDPSWYLYHFLKGNHESAARHSSHLARATQLTQAGHYGIDILGSYQPGASDWVPYSDLNPEYAPQHILPARKSTILFLKMPAGEHIALNTNQTFIKLEDHGLKTWSGFGNHALDFISGTLLGLGASNPEWTRKERIDKNIASSYSKVINRVPAELHTSLELKPANAKGLGLRAMVTDVERIRPLSDGHAELEQAIAQFSSSVAQKRYDHIEMRTGDEVILTEQELKQAIRPNQTEPAQPTAASRNGDWIIDMPQSDGPGLEPAPLAATAAPSEAQPTGLWARVKSWFW